MLVLIICGMVDLVPPIKQFVTHIFAGHLNNVRFIFLNANFVPKNELFILVYLNQLLKFFY